MAEDKRIKVHCNKCLQETNHVVLYTREQSDSELVDVENQISIEWTFIYDLLECAGCEEISVRRRHYFSEWNPGDVDESFFPPKAARALPRWYKNLSKDVAALMEETYQAIQSGGNRLAMMGARALVDMVMVQTVGDVGSFESKLKELQAKGYVSAKNSEVLEAALDAGNAASHRGYKPTPRHVMTVMDIVENLLQATVLQNTVDELKKATPPRAPRPKSP